MCRSDTGFGEKFGKWKLFPISPNFGRASFLGFFFLIGIFGVGSLRATFQIDLIHLAFVTDYPTQDGTLFLLMTVSRPSVCSLYPAGPLANLFSIANRSFRVLGEVGGLRRSRTSCDETSRLIVAIVETCQERGQAYREHCLGPQRQRWRAGWPLLL